MKCITLHWMKLCRKLRQQNLELEKALDESHTRLCEYYKRAENRIAEAEKQIATLTKPETPKNEDN